MLKMKGYRIFAMIMLMTGSSATFSDTELHLLFSLREFFNGRFLVFVDDEIISTGVTNEVKRTSESNIASITITSEQLKIIFERDSEFPWRTIVTAKRSIHLEPLLKLVQNANHLVWALFSEPSDVNSIGNYIPYNGHILLIRTESESLRISELLRSHDGQRASTRCFGFVEIDSKAVHFPDKTNYIHRKSNLSGIDLRIGHPHNPCEPRKDGVLLEKIFCYHSKILDIIEEKLNFRQIANIHESENFSFVTPNGSYAGFFKMLVDEEVDLSDAGFVVTGKRMNDFNFIWPTFVLETMMYVKKSDATRSSISTPFSSRIWMVTSIWVVVMGVFLLVSDHYSGESGKNFSHAFFGNLLKALQLTCNQGSDDTPSFSPSRIVFYTTLVGGMLLYSYYSATVLSYLTIEDFNVPFTNFDGFIKSGKFTMIGIADGFSIYYVKFESSFLHDKISGLIMNEDELPTDLENSIRMLCDGKFLTFLGLRGSVLNIEKAECELMEIPSPILFQYFGFAAIKGFQFGEYFTGVLGRLNEHGIVERMRNNLTKFDSLKALNEGSEYQSVTLEQINNLLTILKIGFLLSLLVLGLEIWKSQRKGEISRGKFTMTEHKK